MTEQSRAPFEWKAVILLTIGIGGGIGLLIALLDAAFGVSLHPALGGLVAGVAIAVVLTRRGRSKDT